MNHSWRDTLPPGLELPPPKPREQELDPANGSDEASADELQMPVGDSTALGPSASKSLSQSTQQRSGGIGHVGVPIMLPIGPVANAITHVAQYQGADVQYPGSLLPSNTWHADAEKDPFAISAACGVNMSSTSPSPEPEGCATKHISRERRQSAHPPSHPPQGAPVRSHHAAHRREHDQHRSRDRRQHSNEWAQPRVSHDGRHRPGDTLVPSSHRDHGAYHGPRDRHSHSISRDCLGTSTGHSARHSPEKASMVAPFNRTKAAANTHNVQQPRPHPAPFPELYDQAHSPRHGYTFETGARPVALGDNMPMMTAQPPYSSAEVLPVVQHEPSNANQPDMEAMLANGLGCGTRDPRSSRSYLDHRADVVHAPVGCPADPTALPARAVHTFATAPVSTAFLASESAFEAVPQQGTVPLHTFIERDVVTAACSRGPAAHCLTTQLPRRAQRNSMSPPASSPARQQGDSATNVQNSISPSADLPIAAVANNPSTRQAGADPRRTSGSGRTPRGAQPSMNSSRTRALSEICPLPPHNRFQNSLAAPPFQLPDASLATAAVAALQSNEIANRITQMLQVPITGPVAEAGTATAAGQSPIRCKRVVDGGVQMQEQIPRDQGETLSPVIPQWTGSKKRGPGRSRPNGGEAGKKSKFIQHHESDGDMQWEASEPAPRNKQTAARVVATVCPTPADVAGSRMLAHLTLASQNPDMLIAKFGAPADKQPDEADSPFECDDHASEEDAETRVEMQAAQWEATPLQNMRAGRDAVLAGADAGMRDTDARGSVPSDVANEARERLSEASSEDFVQQAADGTGWLQTQSLQGQMQCLQIFVDQAHRQAVATKAATEVLEVASRCSVVSTVREWHQVASSTWRSSSTTRKWRNVPMLQVRSRLSTDCSELIHQHIERTPGSEVERDELCPMLPTEWLPIRNMLQAENRGNDLDMLIVLTGLSSLLKQIRWVSPADRHVPHAIDATHAAPLHSAGPHRTARRLHGASKSGTQLQSAAAHFQSNTARAGALPTTPQQDATISAPNLRQQSPAHRDPMHGPVQQYQCSDAHADPQQPPETSSHPPLSRAHANGLATAAVPFTVGANQQPDSETSHQIPVIGAPRSVSPAAEQLGYNVDASGRPSSLPPSVPAPPRSSPPAIGGPEPHCAALRMQPTEVPAPLAAAPEATAASMEDHAPGECAHADSSHSERQASAAPQACSSLQKQPHPRRIKPKVRPADLCESERRFVANTGGLKACAQSYLAMTCTHDAETFLASASLAMQHGEDAMCMDEHECKDLNVIHAKRQAHCHWCKVQQTLWMFKVLLDSPAGTSEKEDDEDIDTGSDRMCCCRCADRRFGLTLEDACYKISDRNQSGGILRGSKKPLVPNKYRLVSVQCVLFRDHLMHASELMLRAAERGVDEFEDCLPCSVTEMLSGSRKDAKCPAKDVRQRLPGLTDFSNLKVSDFAHANAILRSAPVALTEKQLNDTVKRNDKRLDRKGDVNSLHCGWQDNGYAHVQLPETPLANAIILRQFPNEGSSQLFAGLMGGSTASRTAPEPDEYNRLFQAVRAAPHMGCALPKHLLHSEDYLSPSGPGISQAAACLASNPQYPHVHFSRHVIGLVYTPPKGHGLLIDTAHTGLHMDPIGAACLLLADGTRGAARWLFTIGDNTPERFLKVKSLVYRAAYAGALQRSAQAGHRSTPNDEDQYYALSQAEALRLHEPDMLDLAEKHSNLFMTILHHPGELMIVPPGAAHAVVNLTPNSKVSWTGLPPKWVGNRSLLQGVGCALPVCIHNQLFRCTPVQKTENGECSWLPHSHLIGDEGETQRGLAIETAAVLASVACAEEKIIQNEMLCQSAVLEAMDGHF